MRRSAPAGDRRRRIEAVRAREADARLEMIRSLMNRGERWPGLHALLGTLLLLQSRKPDDDHVHFDPVEDR